MNTVRRIVVIVLAVLLGALALVGAGTLYQSAFKANARAAALKVEAGWNWDPDLAWNLDGGAPLLLVKPENRVSLVFMEGFRTQNPAGMYADWFKELHEKAGVNVFVPVYGLQSSPFDLRYREWDPREDQRTVLMAYEAFAANLPAGHRVVTVSQSFGTLPHATILVKAARQPDAAVFLSPLNSGMEYRAAGELVYWLSTQTAWLKYLLPFTAPGVAPDRASVWDIVDPELNRAAAARFPVNPEDSAWHGDMMGGIARDMESRLLPRITGRSLAVVNGDSDLYFSQAGFARFAEILRRAGNSVDYRVLEKSGHMVLLDARAGDVKELIKQALFPANAGAAAAASAAGGRP